MPYFGSAHLIYRPLVRTGYEAKQSLPQRKMGLDAQEQLAKSYKARDVQNGGRCKVVKLESVVTPSMRLYLPRVEARLRGITALKAMSQVRQSSHNPCNIEGKKIHSWRTIATSHNYKNKALHHPDTIKVRLRNQNKRRLPQMLHRSPIVPTGLHY